MKAVRIHEFGGLHVLKLEGTEIPAIHPDEVRIRVYASSVNPVDHKIIAGEAQDRFPTQFPLTIGWDVSGVIEQAGDQGAGSVSGMKFMVAPYQHKTGRLLNTW